MGFNSVMLFLNDRLHEVENDPNVGKEIARAINEAGRHDGKYHYYDHQLECLGVEHMDIAQVIVVGGNTGRQAFTMWEGNTQLSDEAIVRAWADKLGYTLRRKPKK